MESPDEKYRPKVIDSKTNKMKNSDENPDLPMGFKNLDR